MKILVTGAAGFIGMHTCLKLLKNKIKVVGVDNLNKYYSVKLKKDRIKNLKKFKNFEFKKIDIAKHNSLVKIFKKFKPQYVIHLAAQAGVRYSIENPFEYTRTNLVGFGNMLECCKLFKVKHLVFASSSSVYGGNKSFPFKEKDNVDHPISLYAASKKSNEVMAHSYSHLFKLPITGLRFFTVFGPWGRPDMFLFLLTKAIKTNKSINIFNRGKMFRDFTYIDDIVDAVLRITKKIPKYNKKNLKVKILKTNESSAPFKIFNIGNNKPIHLEKFIYLVEKALNKKSKKNYIEMQKGDVSYTHANISSINRWIKFRPKTSISKGIEHFVEWYNNYFK
jgi:UDP-glucuronate 4-epimerase